MHSLPQLFLASRADRTCRERHDGLPSGSSIHVETGIKSDETSPCPWHYSVESKIPQMCVCKICDGILELSIKYNVMQELNWETKPLIFTRRFGCKIAWTRQFRKGQERH